jgi:iron complex transport system substrate-binding protein
MVSRGSGCRLEPKEPLVRFRILLLPLLVLLIAACSEDESPSANESPTGATAVAAEASPTGEAAAPGPMSFTGSDGVTVEFETPPQRIVSLASHATEIFCAVGAGEQLVAVDAFANCPAGSDAKPAVDAFQPSVEAIVAYDPDLVYAWYDPGDLVSALRGADVPVLFLEVPADLAGVFDNIRLIGQITGHEGEADALIADMESQRDTILDSLDGVDAGPRIFHESDATLFTVRSDTFVGALYTLLKAQNIADEAETPYPQLSSEAVVAADPEVIVLADFADPAEVAARPGWSAISAVANDRICVVDPNLTDRPGPYIMDGLQALADCLYTED